MFPDASLGSQWAESFADASGHAFARIVAPDAVLDGSIFVRPVRGRDAVWATLRGSAGIYDRLDFAGRTAGDGRLYLEWTAAALGLEISGATILSVDGQGLIAAVSLFHRPLPAVLAFSAEMGRRLSAYPGADHFY